MTGITPVPQLTDSLEVDEGRNVAASSIDCIGESITLLCAKYAVKPRAIYEAAWALTLAQYARTDFVQFYSTHQRAEKDLVTNVSYEIDRDATLLDLISNTTTAREGLGIDDILIGEGEALKTCSIVAVRDTEDALCYSELFLKHKVRSGHRKLHTINEIWLTPILGRCFRGISDDPQIHSPHSKP